MFEDDDDLINDDDSLDEDNFTTSRKNKAYKSRKRIEYYLEEMDLKRQIEGSYFEDLLPQDNNDWSMADY
ncbi:MAG: hypothetical protein OEY89_01785 [Gammaproteobacteria bacterium]|nr:hypothetical protein [Gammaproteobacteria bacterium]